ncbi:hypothetical protein HED60_06300 [Planctomycetales bacterium ZRK34]|nr:hypothetical protein HED60_06300 [Planctomycetales bacterium ZRK34]
MNTTRQRRTLTLMLAAAMTIMVVATTSAWAKDYYVTPAGVGDKTGADWDNAMDRHAMVILLGESIQPGDRMLLGSGEYGLIGHRATKTISIPRGGTPELPITLEGVDTGEGLPHIFGKYSVNNVKYHAHSYSGISLGEGVSHVRIAHLRLSQYMSGITNGGKNAHIEIEDVHIEQVREGVVLEGLSESSFRHCTIKSYAKRGMGFEAGCDNLQIIDVEADCTAGVGGWKTEAFPFGFCIESESSNHHIRFERCVARNNLWQGPDNKYWNGDGFTAESKAHHISYYDCAAYNNTDGGWDNKSLASVMERCVSVGNKRNIRIWNSHGGADQPTRLTDCLSVNPVKRGGNSNSLALWVTGTVEVEMSTFVGGESTAIQVDDHAPGGNLTLRNCIVTSQHESPVLVNHGAKYDPVDVATDAPQFEAPSPDWLGEPAGAYNSKRYGKAKGYHAE